MIYLFCILENKYGKLDLEYTCTVMGNLSGIPIRIYKNGKLDFYHSLIALSKDPICINLDSILAIKEHVGYFVNPYFAYYGIVNSGNQKSRDRTDKTSPSFRTRT